MQDEGRIVRPPEFKKVLEELHVVRLGDNLKSEIQARRDLEDVYHRLLEDITALEETIETSKAEADEARTLADQAGAARASIEEEASRLSQSLTRTRVFCYSLLALAAALLAFAWQPLWSTVSALLQTAT